ncbi:MAG: BolA family protein [Methylophilaceae bacterium]|nr:BolA family protein [Methylophilaceae bacterium]
MTLVEEIHQKLAALSPTDLALEDESAFHTGHKGNTGGGHFKLFIVSSQFCGKSQIIRHRLVYQALAGMIPHRIHALSIHAVATDEVA